jgi:hypothetical protein
LALTEGSSCEGARAAKKAAPARKKAAVKKAALKKTAATKSIRDIESSSEIHRRVKRD